MNKRLLAALLSIVAAASVNASAAKEEINLFSNGGFEQVLNVGWYRHLQTDYTRTTDKPHSGEYCLTSTQDYSNEYHCQDILLTPGETYDLSFWARTAEGFGTQKLGYVIRYGYELQNSRIVGTNVNNELLNMTAEYGEEWTEIKTTFTYDGKDKYGRELFDHTFQFRFHSKAANSLGVVSYYDDFRLVPHGNVKEEPPRMPDEYHWDEDPLPEAKERNDKKFADTANNWARDTIDILASEGVINGTSDTTYEPLKQVTRAEFVTLLVNTFNIRIKDTNSGFRDVDEDAWYANAITKGKSLGIIPQEMVRNNKFYPEQPLTRGEACGIIAKYAELTEAVNSGKNISFTDSGSFGVWADAIAKTAAYGVVNGYPEGDFRAGNSITRAETAEMLKKVVELSGRRYFYVDPRNGNDDNDGTKNAPFKSIYRAQKAVREVNSNMSGNIYVLLKAGAHYMDKTLSLKPEDSGTNGFKVIYTSYGNGNASLSGGVSKVLDWSLYDSDKGIYRANVGVVNTRNMYVNGVRAVRAKSEGPLEKYQVDVSKEYQAATSSKWMADLTNVEDVEISHYGSYYCNHRPLLQDIKLDGDNVRIKYNDTFTKSGRFGALYLNLNLWVENAYELLDREGEFYLNRKDGYLYYKPRAWENLATAEITLPTTETLIEGKGKIDDNVYEPVHNISFENVSFSYTATWNIVQERGGLNLMQNATLYGPLVGSQATAPNRLLPAAVYLEDVSYIDFEGCTFSKIGGMALGVMGGIQHTYINGNEFYDISGNAMQVGHPTAEIANMTAEYRQEIQNESYPIDKRYYKADIQITNNYIHDTAVEMLSAGAMAVTNLQYSNVSHNEIFRTSYSGIHSGFGFAARPRNLFYKTNLTHNYIHKTNSPEFGLHDGGAIYQMSTTMGDLRDADTLEGRNLFSYNYCEDQGGSVNLIYLDEGVSWMEISNNVFNTDKDFWSYGMITSGNNGKYNIVNKNYLLFDSMTVIGKKVEPFTEWYKKTNGVLSDEDVTQPQAHTYVGEQYILPESMEDWQDGAKEIVANAGITDGYIGNFTEEFQDVKLVYNDQNKHGLLITSTYYLPATYDMASGDILTLEFDASNRKGEKGYVSPDRVSVENNSPDVVEVLPDNRIKALKFGKAELTVRVLCGKNKDVVEILPVEIYVDDEVEQRDFKDEAFMYVNGTLGDVKVMTGEKTPLDINFMTKLGRRLIPHSYTVRTTEDFGEIDEEGNLVGKKDGKGKLIFDIEWGSHHKKSTCVRAYKSLTNEMYEEFDESQIVHVGDDFFKKENWTYRENASTDVWEELEDGIGLSAGRLMYYNKEPFNNKLLHFKMRINVDGGWPSFALNVQNVDKHLERQYVMSFYPGAIEWLRFTDAQRYVLWGNGNAFDGTHPIFGGRTGSPIQYKEFYDVAVGVFDVPQGTRTLLYVDGIKAFDEIDYFNNEKFNMVDEDVPTGGGYFGIHQTNTAGRFELYKPDMSDKTEQVIEE